MGNAQWNGEVLNCDKGEEPRGLRLLDPVEDPGEKSESMSLPFERIGRIGRGLVAALPLSGDSVRWRASTIEW